MYTWNRCVFVFNSLNITAPLATPHFYTRWVMHDTTHRRLEMRKQFGGRRGQRGGNWMKGFVDWTFDKALTPVVRSVANKIERAREQRGGRKEQEQENVGACNATPAWWTIQDGSLHAATVLWTMESLKKGKGKDKEANRMIVYTVVWTNVVTSLKALHLQKLWRHWHLLSIKCR